MSFGWNYPPGVTGSEPEITGEWPCPKCGGEGGDREDRTKCWFCGGSGIAPEEAPDCPDCGTETEFVQEHVEAEPDYERVYCPDCGKVQQ